MFEIRGHVFTRDDENAVQSKVTPDVMDSASDALAATSSEIGKKETLSVKRTRCCPRGSGFTTTVTVSFGCGANCRTTENEHSTPVVQFTFAYAVAATQHASKQLRCGKYPTCMTSQHKTLRPRYAPRPQCRQKWLRLRRLLSPARRGRRRKRRKMQHSTVPPVHGTTSLLASGILQSCGRQPMHRTVLFRAHHSPALSAATNPRPAHCAIHRNRPAHPLGKSRKNHQSLFQAILQSGPFFITKRLPLCELTRSQSYTAITHPRNTAKQFKPQETTDRGHSSDEDITTTVSSPSSNSIPPQRPLSATALLS